MPERPLSGNEEMLAHYRKRQSRLYRMLRPPLPLIHNSKERKLPGCEGIQLWIGGAGGWVPPGFVNVDFEALPGVDIAADVQRLPFRDGSVAAIECDAVLEHVPDPRAAVDELARVLRPGGFIHLVVPFNHPYHAYPRDYQRWTAEGLRHLLTAAQCEVVEEGIRTGPTATLLSFFCEYCRIVAPKSLGKVAYAAANWVVWPLRYFDVWLNRKKESHLIANSLYVLGRKSQ
jgi:SAM-dependent methyltransferase